MKRIIYSVPPAMRQVKHSLHSFLRLETAGGIVLMVAALLALLLANSPLSTYYDNFLELPVSIKVGDFSLAKPLILWINDGLMAVFFFLVGMELKREVIEGHLSSLKKASLPAFAALGGMIAPAMIYILFNNPSDAEALRGWAIPTATDIAFALGVLSLLGRRVSTALKAFLLSIAIFDDLGAVVIIALFYTSELSALSLVISAILIAGLAYLNHLGVMRPGAYILIGVILWIAVLKSGVHATLAGVILALFIPLRTVAKNEPLQKEEQGGKHSPLRHLEHTLHPWVAFGVLPIFAFANAGVNITDYALKDVFHPVPLGIIAGLFLGKQLGIMTLCWLSVQLKLAVLPAKMSWSQLYGTALLCGIGFTMSLFIASLAFEQGSGAYFGLERFGVLVGTALSGVAGYIVLHFALPHLKDRTKP